MNADSTDSVNSTDADYAVIPAYLGWRNEPDRLPLRLYATDDGDSPRWDTRWPSGRVAEQAITERFGLNCEGDRYLVVRVGNRFTSDEMLQSVAAAVRKALGFSTGTAAMPGARRVSAEPGVDMSDPGDHGIVRQLP
jgi:hypothetical protein